MDKKISAEKVIQNNTLALLQAMGYHYIPEDENKKRRDNKLSEVILKDVLKDQLQKINSYTYKGNKYPFSPKNINNAIKSLDEPLSEGMMVANAKISDQLVLGNSYEERLPDGTKRSFSLKYIDFENIENNVFHCTEEFGVKRVGHDIDVDTRKPDIVLFVNGIPFAVIELKRSSVSTEQGISQMVRNQNNNEIPQLFKYIQITLAGNTHDPKYATAGTPAKFYGIWREEDLESPQQKEKDVSADLQQLMTADGKEPLFAHRTPSRLDETVFSLFGKQRALELIKDFILFDANIKKIARYQQYFAIKRTIRSINQKESNGARKGGLVWHTQGSGKSLTMVMLAKKLIGDIPGSRIIVVTDRVDLDKQIHETFEHNEIETKKATSGKDLIKLLHDNRVKAITTIINKFQTVQNEKIVIDDPDLFVMVDESHRTQGGDLHQAMKKVFPRACYIGFTGTPLLKSEKSTFKKFGKLLHKYSIDQATKDKAVVPLLYEGRMVEQWVNDEHGMDRKFQQITKNLNDEQKKDLQKKWARFQKVASSERRLEVITMDINEHYTSNFKGTGFKAMLATSSKYEAIKYHQLFEEWGDIKTAFVISPPDQREGYEDVGSKAKEFIAKEWQKVMSRYGSEEVYNTKIISEFIEGDDIDLLIVVDKLLTGFDAPRATILYIDKELKDHSLLQAIARVNRLYEGKDFGYIIDYRGLLGNLDQALADYGSLSGFDEEDIAGAVIDIKTEIAKVKTFYSYLEEMFQPIKNKSDQEEYEQYLGDEERRKKFYNYLKFFARSLKLALSSEKINDVLSQQEIDNYKKKMKFYIELRKSVEIRYHEKIDFGSYEQQMQKMMDTFVSAKEATQITELIDITDSDFENKTIAASPGRKRSSGSLADAILSASSSRVTEKMESNPAKYKEIARRIQEIIQEYKEGRLSDQEKLEKARQVRQLLLDESGLDKAKYPESIKDSTFAQSLYDNLEQSFEAIGAGKEYIAQSALKMRDIFLKVYKKPDWVNNIDVRKEIEGDIEDILWDAEDDFGQNFDNRDELLQAIVNIGISHYR